jgi:hypothetical protein
MKTKQMETKIKTNGKKDQNKWKKRFIIIGIIKYINNSYC